MIFHELRDATAMSEFEAMENAVPPGATKLLSTRLHRLNEAIETGEALKLKVVAEEEE